MTDPPTIASPREAIPTIGELISSTFWVDGETPIGNVLRVLQRQPGTDSVAVIDGARVGLVVRSRLLMQLGRRFGYSLYEHRRLEGESRARPAALAELSEALRVPLHAVRGGIRALLADPDLSSRHQRTLQELLRRTSELLARLASSSPDV